MRRFVLVLAISALAVAAAIPAGATHAWGPYHWARTSNPFTLKVVDSVTSQWQSAFNTAVSDWNASSVLNMTTEQGSETSQSRKRCTPISGKIRVCNQSYGFNGWLGIAQIWLTTGSHIAQGITKLNDSYHNGAPYSNPEWRSLVACQEIGHDLGLDHQDENNTNPNLGTCMDYTNNPLGPPANTHPNQHDYDMLQTIYGHNDSFNSYALRLDPIEHGQEIRIGGDTDRVGFHITKDGAYTVITWIFWV